jgi:uncharacterized protein
MQKNFGISRLANFALFRTRPGSNGATRGLGREAWPRVAAAMLAAFCTVGPAGAQSLSERTNKGLVEILTGGVGGTAAQITTDLANVIDDGATRRVRPVIGRGSLQNVTDLRALRGIDIAILPVDVLNYAKERRLVPGIESITYVAKLYDEEFHLLAGPEVRSIANLAGKRVNFGAPADGTAITSAQIFRLLGIEVEPTSHDPLLALEKLRSGEIAAMTYVAGKPASLFLDRRLPQGLHFLSVPATTQLLSTYVPASLTADDYPGLVPPQEPIETVAIGAVMAVAPLAPDSERYRNVARFAEAFFSNFPQLLETARHPKWQEVNLSAEIPGWRRFPPADAWLRQNPSTGTMLVSEAQLREIFAKYLEERSRVAGVSTTTQQRKDDLFAEFQRWQRKQQR